MSTAANSETIKATPNSFTNSSSTLPPSAVNDEVCVSVISAPAVTPICWNCEITKRMRPVARSCCGSHEANTRNVKIVWA